MDDLVSIIIPTYNVEAYISNCLNSIIFQTYANLEIIVVDDCSTDNTSFVIQDFCHRDARIKYYALDSNQGVSFARNLGIRKANGRFIMFVDGDDYLPSNSIEILLKPLCNNEIAMSMGNLSRVKFDEKIDRKHEKPSKYTTKLIINYLKDYLRWKTPLSACGIIFRSSFINHFFEVGKRHNEDRFFLFQYLYDNVKYQISLTPITVYFIVERDNSVSRSKFDPSFLSVSYFSHRILEICDKSEFYKYALTNEYITKSLILKGIIRSDSLLEYKTIFNDTRRELLGLVKQNRINLGARAIERFFLILGTKPYIFCVKTIDFFKRR